MPFEGKVLEVDADLVPLCLLNAVELGCRTFAEGTLVIGKLDHRNGGVLCTEKRAVLPQIDGRRRGSLRASRGCRKSLLF